MDVTKSNFDQLLPAIKEAIKNCTFASIDCEITGLNVTKDINAFDTPEEYYIKVKKNCLEFLVIQYGLSLFRYDKENNTFKQTTYNFYIFRKPINRNIPDQRFLCESNSIDFLTAQGFDFNKLFKDGLSYLTSQEYEKFKSDLEEKKKNHIFTIQNENKDIIPIPDNLITFIEDVTKKLENFAESNETEMSLPRCGPFAKKLIYQVAEDKFENKLTLESRQVEKDRILFAVKQRPKEREQEIFEKKHEDDFQQLEDYLGFSRVIQVLKDSKKLIVGHNLGLDLMHTIDKFVTPLPEDYEDFKTCVQKIFPQVIDTKYMANSEPFKDLISSTVLKSLLNTVAQQPFKTIDTEIETGAEGYKIGDNKEHKAGYVAFVTGYIFISMWRYLGIKADKSPKDTFKDFKLLKKVLNRIFTMNLVDNQYINLQGKDLNPSRDHVFYLTFPKDWKYNDIVELFSPFGPVFVSWLDDTSAYVSLQKKDQAALALNTLSQSDDSYTIMPFNKKFDFDNDNEGNTKKMRMTSLERLFNILTIFLLVSATWRCLEML
ncbi:poly(A)-specific ribonuclease PARN isoform X1 [Aethina tumida]|uniref:poly(A)-specific ribonuclease PARN isoform X1 n=1 Tax=Aethina tumida TaxID=116153 RepID=UPI00096B192C|nr:poly(A)-specific ribonuclease PARN isoform X1 [Aethina tumida]XP_019870863.1 poly(A)-specific ribonuclease PARN isoform X1 [Aethina tumida]